MARLLVTLGTRDAGGTAAVDARGSVTVAARTRRGAAGAATASSWAAGRRWALLLALGWLVQVGLRVWFSRHQVMPLANPDETAYLVAARVLAGGPAADLSDSTLYPTGYPLLITPAYWVSSDPSTVYHAVMVINAVISALVLPLGYLACRRLGLGRPAAYGVAFVAALVPAGFFYSEYAMTDAVFVVIMLAWLLTTHSWLTASSARVRYANAAGSAALAAYAYAIHSRGLVMVAGLAAMGVLIGWRQAAARLSVLVAALTAVVVAAAGWALNHHISLLVYPEGTRSLSGQIRQRLGSVNGIIHVLEMAAGQLWRVVLDSWGIAGIGLVAALLVIVRRDVRSDLRIMGALTVAVTTLIACIAPAALPSDQAQAWASGRYLDGMIVVFFLVGAAVLLRARERDIVVCAAVCTGLFLLAAVTVAVYIGTTVPTNGFGAGFNFAGPAVVTQSWTDASVALATAVTLVLLGVWIGFAFVLRRLRPGRAFGAVSAAFGVCVAAVSLVAVAQMTSHISQAGGSNTQEAIALMEAGQVRPGDQVAVTPSLGWMLTVPQAFEVSWIELKHFKPWRQSLPAGTTVVETGWPAGKPAEAGWPNAPAGWRIVASNQDLGWVVWRQG
ncbi:MAG TPA: hypothetical protein VHS32_25180 [Streptosporangiaceae bacterium]|nr:hypothetical protein [Streptosporangiaceae bacterium]